MTQKNKPLVVELMGTAKMLNWVKEYTRCFKSAVDMTAGWLGCVRTTHRFSHEGGDKFWHLNLCDDSDETITGKEFRKQYEHVVWMPCPAHVHKFLLKKNKRRKNR